MQKFQPFKLKIHCSQITSIVSGKLGISEEQQKTLDKFDEREKNFTPLSETQQTTLNKLQAKKKAPSLNEADEDFLKELQEDKNPSAARKKTIERLLKKKNSPAISVTQQSTIDNLLEKKKTATALTKNMVMERASLIEQKINPELPKGAKTFAERWLKEQLYMRRKEFTSKYTSKGNIVEDDAIEYIKEYLDLGFARKNELYLENSFVCGTPDLILAEEIDDAKSSWDFDTFPLFEKKIDARYFWQGQGYMILTGKKKYNLCYCLMDMPDKLLDSESGKMMKFSENVAGFENGKTIYKKSFDEIREELKEKHYYSGLPDFLRIKIFPFEYDADCAAVIERRVKMVQQYIDEVLVPEIPVAVIEEIKSYSQAA